MAAATSELLQQACALDPERSLAAMFAPPADRPLLLALVLLNAELARIADVVHEPMAGLIRFQWWRDALHDAAAGGVPASHPALPPIADGLAADRVMLVDLLALLEARELELERLQPQNLDALEAYARATSGRLHMLLARALDAPDAIATVLAGTACQLVGVVAAIGHHARHERTLLPTDRLAAEGVAVGQVMAARNETAVARVAQTILARAEELFAELRRLAPFDRRLMPAVLPARLAARQARRLAAVGDALLRRPVPSRDAWSVPDLLWAMLRRRI